MNKQTGWTFVMFGGGSLVLNMIGYEFVLLMPLDWFGEGIGWAVRIGLLVVGLCIVGYGRDAEEVEYVTEGSDSPSVEAAPLQPAAAPQTFERDADGRAKPLTCEQHGLRYDPSQHSGCVVCRRA